jgi:hypothetical protein
MNNLYRHLAPISDKTGGNRPFSGAEFDVIQAP